MVVSYWLMFVVVVETIDWRPGDMWVSRCFIGTCIYWHFHWKIWMNNKKEWTLWENNVYMCHWMGFGLFQCVFFFYFCKLQIFRYIWEQTKIQFTKKIDSFKCTIKYVLICKIKIIYIPQNPLRSRFYLIFFLVCFKLKFGFVLLLCREQDMKTSPLEFFIKIF